MALPFRKVCGRRFPVSFLVFATAFVLSTRPALSEDHPIYGPRFEIGGGVGYSTQNLPPRWVPGYNRVFLMTGTIRLFKGLAVQGGIDWISGGKPLSDSISYGNYLLKINKGTFGDTRWAGLRYELPMSVLRQDIAGIYSFYGAAGYSWAEMGVQSNEWTYKGVAEIQEKARGFRLADINGPYAILAARWRINNPESEGGNTSWFGSYGLDLGVRYTHYSKMSMAYPNIPKASDKFSSFQVFMVGFLKFRMFE